MRPRAPARTASERLERLGRVDEVLEVPGEDAGLLHRLEHLQGLGRGPAERLGAEDGLAGAGPPAGRPSCAGCWGRRR